MTTNLNLNSSNFSIGPQSGTFCTIDTSSVDTQLLIKNSSGGLIHSYSLSSNIIYPIIHFEYTGPKDIDIIPNGITFITVEYVSSSICMVKRWTLDTSFSILNLKEINSFTTSGLYYYDIEAAAVEYYRRYFISDNPGNINYIELNDVTGIYSGTRIFIGPSTDTDNLGAVEELIVSYVASYGGTYRVYFTSKLRYQYRQPNPLNGNLGDRISYNSYLYLISKKDVGGGSEKGTIFKHYTHSWGLVEVDNGNYYNMITVSRWHSSTRQLASVIQSNLLFIQPYGSYYNSTSFYLNNVEQTISDVYPLYDLVLDGNDVYKLALKTTQRNDLGARVTTEWDNYNFEQDTLAPYSNSISIYSGKDFLVGQYQTTYISATVRDQYGIPLGMKEVNFYKNGGDPIGGFVPPGGGSVLDSMIATTNISGVATVQYKSGYSFDGMTEIKCRVGGSSLFLGSQYVWNIFYIRSLTSYSTREAGESPDIYTNIWQTSSGISNDLNNLLQRSTYDTSELFVLGKNKFSNPGGDWEIDSRPQDNDFDLINQINIFVGESDIPQIKEKTVDQYFQQTKNSFDLQIDQLKLSLHTYWLEGSAYSYLFTNDDINQFIFVTEAIPAFWSGKNPVDTNIWIVLRPYVRSLDPSTLVFMVREVSHAGDTGYVSITDPSLLTVTTYQVSPGLFGLVVEYNPPVDFHYSATVYVHIEVYDTTPSEPNFIYLDYWFTIIPDYKFPYLDNLSPYRGESNVSVNRPITFEIHDVGAGVDIDSFEMYVDHRLVRNNITFTKTNDNLYSVSYQPDKPFYNDKEINVAVKVHDLSQSQNYLLDSYNFFTIESDGVWFLDYDNLRCKTTLTPEPIHFLALGLGDGVDLSTLRVQVNSKDVTSKCNIIPVVYRVS